MQQNLLLTSLTLFLISLGLFVFTFFVFHYLGSDVKFHKTFNKQAQKPFIANLFGMLATFLLASSIVILVLALIAY